MIDLKQIKINAEKLTKNLNITITITGVKKFNFMFNLGIQIIKLGAKLLPIDGIVKIDLEEKQ